MGKIKSAIITALLVAAILVLAFFSLFSWNVPGSNGVKRYNSFISSIHMGGDLTGEASAVLYPEGVLSAEKYTSGIPDDETKREEYIASYEGFGSVYVEKEVLEDGEQAFKDKVSKDAEILSARFGEKGYSSYSVAVQDDFTIKVTVPTNFTYAEYAHPENSGNINSPSDETTAITRTVRYLSYGGELTLRNSETGKPGYSYTLTNPKVNVTDLIKSVSKISRSGTSAVKIKLTDLGKTEFASFTPAIVEASEKTIGFYVGENQLVALTIEEAITSKTFYISVGDDSSLAQDYAITLASVASGNALSFNYNPDDDIDIVYLTPTLGSNAAIYLGVILLLVVVGAIVFSIVRYKKLGLVNTIMIAIYSLAIIVAMLLIEIQLTVAVAFAAVLGLALTCGANFALFEAVRKETKKGKTMQSAIKSGYKSTLTAILDMHIILIIVSLMIALICKGELAACGLVFFIASIASYILYWFTRFMWFVISSPVKDKFKFCGFKREVPLDE
ncbi:MAG: hypothetical protein K2G96_02230 [Clostridia bacterium]|nr:hypothetical protein [Clostridia bacterium]